MMIQVLKSALCWALMAAALPCAVAAQESDWIGNGRLFNNDFLGDGHDRWRSSSYTLSFTRGPEWTGDLPYAMGEVMEYRLRTEIISPFDITNPAPGDRRYAGILSFGAHTHFAKGPAEISLGGDLVVVGPQTGVDTFQRAAHQVLGQPLPDAATATQLGNAIYPTVLAELTYPIYLTDTIQSRPFVEAQVGVESFFRVGSDLVIGRLGRGDLWLRDSTSGQSYLGTHTSGTGYSIVLGGDIAFVGDSYLLQSSDGFTLTNSRSRLRAGVNYQAEKVGVFYGLTWLSEEFKGQPEGQIIGSLNLRMDF